MIEIITEKVDMPPSNERRYKYKHLDPNGKKWAVTDTQNNKEIYKGSYVNSSLICYNLNKKFYKTKKETF